MAQIIIYAFEEELRSLTLFSGLTIILPCLTFSFLYLLTSLIKFTLWNSGKA